MAELDELPCGLGEILEAAEEEDCLHFHRPLHAAADSALAKGADDCARLLRSLADAASLHLRVDNPNEPFGPLMVVGDRRTAIPEDFDEVALEELEALAPAIPSSDLRARLADLVWQRLRRPDMARLAVEAYLARALETEDPDMWPPCIEMMERGAQLARGLGGASEELAVVQEQARAMLARHAGDDPLFLSAKLIELLLEFGGEDPGAMALIAEHAAESARQQKDWHRAQTYLEIAGKCRAKAGAKDEARQQLLAAAETLVDQASDAAGSDSYLVASVHLQRAIDAFRRIGGTKERVEELHHLLLDYQKESVREMKVVSVPVPTEELTTGAVEQVTDRDWEDAFLVLGHAVQIPQLEELEEFATKSVDEYPLQHLFSHMRLNEQGKVVARSSGGGPGDDEGRQAAIRLSMYQHATLRHQLTGGAVIEPMRRKISEQHDLGVEGVLELVNKSSFVPSERRPIYARGLLAGFQGDYLVAAHILVPQLEHAIRETVAANGILVSGLDQYGIQQERGLNYLLYQDFLDDVLTPGVVFDLKALLVDRHGANFRNRLAHGLLETGAFESPVAAYVWWMAIHLLVGFWEVEPAQPDEN